MNLKDALMSGSPFKRPGRYCSLLPGEYFPADRTFYPRNVVLFTLEDVLSDNWELKEAKVTVTSSQLARAWSDSWKEVETELRIADVQRNDHSNADIFRRMLRKIGL